MYNANSSMQLEIVRQYATPFSVKKKGANKLVDSPKLNIGQQLISIYDTR
jgi:hypothetical protein